jgi:hypothetical protein
MKAELRVRKIADCGLRMRKCQTFEFDGMAKKEGEIKNWERAAAPSLPLGHSAYDHHDEAGRHGDRHFGFDR